MKPNLFKLFLILLFSPIIYGDMTMTDNSNYYDNYAKSDGVTKTASGLLYKKLNSGDGAMMPTKDNVVTVHYEGKLIDGTEFDSSYKRGVPAKFGVTQVIPGWVEGLQLMVVGDEYEFVIPANLAYGENGIAGVIPGGSVLIFKVKLIDIA